MYPLLQINNLRVDFDTAAGVVTAVRDITLTINRGEITGIAGESGSGKSVTALAVLRLLASPPAKYVSGEILFSPDGGPPVNILKLTPAGLRQLRGKKIAMIFQEPMTSLNPVFTCGSQVAEAVRLHRGTERAAARDIVLRLFEKVKLPDPAAIFDRYPHQLSGGQKQRVMIALAMSGNPALLICDEPTTALDVTVQQAVLRLIADLQAETGMGVIFISHDLAVIAGIAARAVIMRNGAIVEQGPLPALFRHPGHTYTRSLLACRPALYTRDTRLPTVNDLSPEPPPGAQSPSPGRHPPRFERAEHPGASPPPSNLTSHPLLRVVSLHIWYPAKKTLAGKALAYNKAVNGISFDVCRGETLGLVGESGCGKTTLGRALLRLVKTRSGQIIYKGRDLWQLRGSELQRFRKNVQIVFQDPYSSLNPSLTVGSAIEEPLQVHEPALGAAVRKQRVMELLEKVRLRPEHYHRYPHEFSGGQRQRIVIARALVCRPEFIVCDESVSALDLSVQAQVLNLLNDLKKEFGFTCLFISHDLAVVQYMSDRIIVMNKGVIEEIGAAAQVYNQPVSPYTRQLLAAMPSL